MVNSAKPGGSGFGKNLIICLRYSASSPLGCYPQMVYNMGQYLGHNCAFGVDASVTDFSNKIMGKDHIGHLDLNGDLCNAVDKIEGQLFDNDTVIIDVCLLDNIDDYYSAYKVIDNQLAGENVNITQIMPYNDNEIFQHTRNLSDLRYYLSSMGAELICYKVYPWNFGGDDSGSERLTILPNSIIDFLAKQPGTLRWSTFFIEGHYYLLKHQLRLYLESNARSILFREAFGFQGKRQSPDSLNGIRASHFDPLVLDDLTIKQIVAGKAIKPFLADPN